MCAVSRGICHAQPTSVSRSKWLAETLETATLGEELLVLSVTALLVPVLALARARVRVGAVGMAGTE